MSINTIKRRLNLTTIYHLVVQEKISSFHTLVHLTNSLPLDEMIKINDDECIWLNMIENRFKIRQFCIEQINDIKDVDFIWKYFTNI
jgi:hypothetical protein